MNTEARRLHDEALKLMPEGAQHDTAACAICKSQASETPPASSSDDDLSNQPDPSTEGGKQPHMDTLTKETHEALVVAAVDKATEALSGQVSSLEEQVSTLTSERDSAQSENATLQGENKRLNGELDTAQVALKAAQDESAALKKDLEERDEQARLNEIAQTRSQQVRNLKLFSDEQITEKAQKWAAASDEDWADRLAEWQAIRGEVPEGEANETASALTGSNEAEIAASNGKPKSARRAVLGLDNG